MEFLKSILGDELYGQFAAKIGEYNSSDVNKDKQVKLVNLTDGGYVAQSEYDTLNEKYVGSLAELDTANTLIETLKSGSKGNEDLQGKISEYETQVTDLQAQLAETMLKSAVRLALSESGAADADYLEFKLRENGETLELDENGKIKGWEDKLSVLKTQYPKMFESGENGSYRVLGDNRLPDGEHGDTSEPKNLADAIRMKYEKSE